jgi:puromycin-sensitive aminopeptidase
LTKSKAKPKPKPARRSAGRLSPTVRPMTIDLHFDLDPTEKTFRGSAEYALQIDRRTRTLELHAADLRISKPRLQSGDVLSKPRIERRPDSESIVLHFDHLLSVGSVRLKLDFRGRVRNDLRGLYRSVDREAPWLATQLCPTDARRFFPCFDEPGIKARYRIRVTTAENQTVLSNSPVEFEEKLGQHRKTVHFETTPLLSAYLIAVAVGPFVASPALMSGATAIRVYTLPDRQKLADFARETAAESLSRLEEWFDMEHPYAKLDLLALPDFAFGAMENAGAVFFRDSVLLLDTTEASFEDRKRAAETITHEISHMWFGNLVTMAWWNDLWLNESFATWMAYEIIDGWHPDWRIWLDFAHRRESALSIDALASSHPIAPKIRNAEEAHENFDAITYTKGACVLRMLEGFMGRDVFRDGIRLYMRRHREGAASASDLWTALGEISGLAVEEIVAPWTLQTGYPLVSLRRKKQGKGMKGVDSIELTQSRFLALPPHRSRPKHPTSSAREPKAQHWRIPWVGRTGQHSGAEPQTLNHLLVNLRDRVPGPDTEMTWIYGNARETGFFRTEHGEPESEDLLANLSALSATERIGFIGNQWALARAGKVSIARLLELLAALGEEEDPEVLLAVGTVLGRLGQRLAANRGPEIGEAFRAWILAHFSGQVGRLGLDARVGETLRERMRRAQIFRIVGHLALDDEIREFCAMRCKAYFSSDRPLPSELGDAIIRIAASQGDESLHVMLCEATRNAETPQTRQRMLYALAEFDNPKLLRASLAASLDTRLAPTPDRAALLIALLGRPSTASETWQHLKKSWSRFEKQMPPILLARLAAATADALPFSTASDIKDFFERHPLTAGTRVRRQIAEELSIAKRFDAHAGTAFEDYLAKH